MKKSIIVMLGFAFLIAEAVVLAQKSETVANFFVATRNVTVANEQSTKSNNPTIKRPVTEIESNVLNSQTPDYIFYDMFFNMVKSFDSAAERRGANGRIWREHIRRKTGFSDQQMIVVRQVTNEFHNAVRPIHQQAMQIINQRRAARAGRQPPFTPSLELQTLQLQRNTVALTFRDRLQNLLGSEAIARLRQTIQQNYGVPQTFTDAEQQLFSERARNFRNNRRGNGNE